MTLDLRSQNIVITGGAGFLGRNVHTQLLAGGVDPSRITVARSRDFDLTTRAGATRLLDQSKSPTTLLIHCAGRVGGLGLNRAQPARMFTDNLLMLLNILDAAAEQPTPPKIVTVGSMTSYPADAPLPFHESSLFRGLPDPEIASYGIGKLAAIQALAAYRKQYGIASACAVLVNLYGPGDNVDDPATTHVAGALLKRFAEAARENLPEVVCWGTGAPTRDFIHIRDAAAGVIRIAEEIDDGTPINIASGREVSIKQLAETIARAVSYKGKIVWDASKGDGVARRCLDISTARSLLNWQPAIDFESGWNETAAWYLNR